MKRNPFTKSVDGIGPGPGDMAQARIRAMATIDRQNEQAKLLSQYDIEPVRRGYSPKPIGDRQKRVSDPSPEREDDEANSQSKTVKRNKGLGWLQRFWTARG